MTTFKTTALAAASVLALAMPAAANTIVDIAAGDERFSTLVAAVSAAGLVETLQGPGPFTVYAPVNEAFAALPEGTVEDLLKPENIDQLTAILTYHVVPGKVMAADVATGEVEAVSGVDLSLMADNGSVMVEEATVVSADIEATNGVIHVIDQVLIPSS